MRLISPAALPAPALERTLSDLRGALARQSPEDDTQAEWRALRRLGAHLHLLRPSESFSVRDSGEFPGFPEGPVKLNLSVSRGVWVTPEGESFPTLFVEPCGRVSGSFGRAERAVPAALASALLRSAGRGADEAVRAFEQLRCS